MKATWKRPLSVLHVVRQIKHDLVALLRRDGFANVAQAVGTESR